MKAKDGMNSTLNSALTSALKSEWRRTVLKKRDALSTGEQKRASYLITESIVKHPWFTGSEKLLIYVSYGSEIDTKGIITEALRKGKKVFVPRVEGKEIIFYRIDSLDELRPGYKGILEPLGAEFPESESYLYEEQTQTDLKKTLLIMPGVAFDSENNRMGYGKGFYDRFLADKADLRERSVAIGHRCQMTMRKLPCEEHDLKPCKVITV